MTQTYCGVANVKSTQIKNGIEFKNWLNTLPESLRASVRAYRQHYITTLKNRKRHER